MVLKISKFENRCHLNSKEDTFIVGKFQTGFTSMLESEMAYTGKNVVFCLHTEYKTCHVCIHLKLLRGGGMLFSH